MMNYNEIFNKAFSDLSPVTNNEAICRNVIERARNMERKSNKLKRTTIILLASAIGISAATVTVGAATDWDYFGVFKSIFGYNAENFKENIISEGECIENSIEGLDIKLAAAAADDKAALVILDIVSKNEPIAVYKGNDVYEILFDQKYDIVFEFDDIATGTHWGYTGEAINENHIRIPVRLGTTSDITGKTINVIVKEEKSPDRKWEAEFNVDIENKEFIYKTQASFEMQIMDRDDMEEYVRMQTTGDYEKKYMAAQITEITATPITIHLKGSFPVNYFNVISNDETCVITDSGEKIAFSGTGSEGDTPEGAEYYNGMYIELAEPINPEKIKSIMFNGVEVFIK